MENLISTHRRVIRLALRVHRVGAQPVPQPARRLAQLLRNFWQRQHGGLHQPDTCDCSLAIRARMHRRITEFWLASVGAASFSIHALTSSGTRKRTDLVSSLRDMIRHILCFAMYVRTDI